MKKIFTHLFVVLLLSQVSANAWAQLTELEVGKVYRFVSARADRSLAADGTDDVHVKETNAADTKQEWYVTKDGDYYVLRNVACGKYLKGAYSAYTSWSMTDDYSDEYNKFELYTSNSTLNTLKTKGSDGYGYMHDDNNGDNGGYNVVGWLNGASNTGTHWTITKVDYTAEQITALLEKAPTTAELAGYTTALEAIFSDAACTILKSAYTTTSMTDEQLAADANYSALPQTLKNMVKKVRNDEWSEATIAPADRPNGNNNTNHSEWTVEDTWGHEYAKKFRVQMYEPYSVEGEITSYLRINAHCNMDNPTGIYANAGEPIYIMVEGDIAEGAELWVAHQTGHGVTNYYNNAAYTQLKKGLNVIPYASDGCQLWINYLVHTYNTSTGEFSYKLSDYKPLKIHIEGGHINGFFNAMGDYRSTEVTGDANGGENLWGEVDNDADWDYYKARAALATDFALLGHRQTLLFPFGAWDSTNGYFGVANNDGGIEKALAWHLENITVPATPNCYAGSGKAFGNYSDTYYPGMNLDAETGKINIMLEAWDRIQYSEHASLGLLSVADINKMNTLYPRWSKDGEAAEIYNYGSATVNGETKTYKDFCQGIDYSDYYNHHGAAVGSGSGYMSGGWRVCNYHYNTMGSIIGKIAAEAGPTWGPAHEIGHQHQTIFNLNGQTEVTNNFHSNVAVWYMGMGTSRVNGSNGSLESVLGAFNTDGNDLYTNNIWAITHLYYRLWLYYHLAGKNTQFWPRLFELLRQVPIVNGAQISGETSLLRFYQHACDAAGEDLTEFFRAHGFFEIMDNRFVGDYSNATYNVTQEQIDAAIKSVKDKGYPVNYAVLLINDATSETTLKHDGTTKRALWDTNASAEYGSVTDFINGNVSVETAYTATVSTDGVVTMSGGEGGVGFLVLNEDGEIVSFSNKSTFAISDEAAYLLATGKASVVTVDTESTTTEAEVDVTAMRFALLQELIENAIALTQNSSETRVGFYKSSAVENLQEYVTMAQDVIANGDLANLQAVYELLYAEYNAVVANEFSRVPLVPGSKYAILAKTNDRILSFSNTTVVTVAATENYTSTANNQWYVERDGAFHIKNAGNSKYIQNVTDQNGVLYTVGDEVVNMNINEIQLGCYSIATSTVPGRYVNMDGANNARVITWGDTGNNSQWKFILLEENETNAAKEDLLELAKKTLALVNEVATVSYNEGSKIALQSGDNTVANYIWSNAAVSGNDVDKLLDSDKNTFFHSQWNNSTAPADGWGHHISVDLGTSSTLTSFKFKFTTRNTSNLSNYPKTIEVYGSNVGGNDVANYTRLQVASGFATGEGVDNEALVMGNGTAYRYLRFLVTDATGNNSGTNTGSDGMVFFHMSEFSIYPVTVSATVKSDYTSGVTVDAVLAAYNDAEQGKTVYNNASATIDDINAKKTALGDGTAAGSYTTLLNQYNSVLNSVLEAKKTELQTLITNTNSLIESVGSVEFADVPFALTTENLYCNDYHIGDGDDSSENYVEKLTDGNHYTYLHTDWNNTNSAGSAPHYLRVDMGEGETITQFKFSYTTRSDGRNCPTTIVVEGSNDAGGNGTYTTIKTLTKDANGLPEDYATFNSETITSTVSYRYIRFRVTATESGDSFFVMSEFSFTKANQPVVTMTNTSTKADEALVFDTYLATAKSQKLYDIATAVALLDAAIADQQAAYDKLDKAIKTPADLDKSGLEELVALAQPLYNKMATDGVVNVDYAPSALTNAQLTAASDALAAANEALASATSQAALDEAKATLQTAYDALLAVENANEKNTITTTDLSTLIGSVEALLERVATTGTSKGEIALQVGDANSEFYIWSNAPAGDCNGYSNKVEGLIDVNEDGSANTGTFFGTAWSPGAVAAYTHYLEVDLGVATSINKLSMDYTTRASGYENQRPTAIKILGSNNKVDYTEVTTIEEGLATGACEQWAMETPLELGARYRYIRFAVATQEATGYFNMSDFNLYSISDRQFSDYYSTADADLNALLLALEVAKDALSRHYLTSAQYTAIKDKLNSVYNDVNNVIALDYTTRDDLTTLIADTETLIGEVATVTEVVTPVLSTTNLYCNADNSTNDSAGDSDKLGVAALLDGDVTTHLHTTYGNNAQDDNLDHYIRVYMGDDKAVAAFEFSYTGRSNNSGNDPSTIIIQGCNTVDGEWVDIKTLTNLPTDGDKVQYSSGLIEASKAYRYIRFMVTETENNSYTTYNDIQHKFFVMSEFSFTAYPTVEVAEGFTNVTTALVRAAYDEKNTATAVNGCYMTESDYDEALAALQADYDALDAAATADKSELEALIDATEALKSQLYKHTYTQGSALTLQADNAELAYYLYCNAPESNAPSAVDNVGVSALIDSDETNYLHTEWTGDQSADGLDHYLRVDLGEDGKLSDFVFSYKSARDLPRTFVVEGCNTADGEYERIGLYVGANTTNTLITSGLLGNGNEYRYLRFRVIATQSNKKDNNGYHRFFVLNDFDVYPVSNIVATNELKDEYASAIYIYTTTDLVTEVTDGITQAQGVVDDASVNQGAVNAEIESLQAVYDKLAEALRYANAPVEITTDEANPVLYNIISKRADDGSKVLQYCEFDAENPKTVSVSDKTANNSYQAWYFMESTNGVVIKPFNGDGKVLGADNTGNGHTKVWAVAEDEKSYDEWNFVARADAYYNIQAYDGSNYFSNMNGVDYKMGFWSGSPESDGGSLFKFVKATFENDNARFYQLSDLENTLEYRTADTPEGEMVGAFVNGAAYSEAYIAASTLITAGNTSDATACREAYTALRTASENLEEIVIEEGKYYRIDITPGLTGDRAGVSMCIDDKGKLAWGEFVDADARFYFTFEYDSDDNLYMKNLHTATYLDEALANNANKQVGADAELAGDAKKVAVNRLGVCNEKVVLSITPDGGAMLNCKAEDPYIVTYDNTDVDKASAWVITEVDEISGVMENVVHSVSLGADESGSGKAYSTLYLGYNATIPEGVTASVVTEINEIGQLVMEEVTGDILPAKTAVVLSGENAGGAEFKYADGEPSFSTEDNILKGTPYTKVVHCGDTSNIYMLAKKSGRVAFYWTYENCDANGDKVTVEGKGTNHNEGGYVKCNANKAYLQVSEGTQGQAAAAMFGFHFGGNTTDIDSINAVADTYDNVYDLQGRKLEEITSPGIYIVGGKKVLVK